MQLGLEQCLDKNGDWHCRVSLERGGDVEITCGWHQATSGLEAVKAVRPLTAGAVESSPEASGRPAVPRAGEPATLQCLQHQPQSFLVAQMNAAEWSCIFHPAVRPEVIAFELQLQIVADNPRSVLAYQDKERLSLQQAVYES
ncbi:hypothetical protein NDU88_005508 [Pleurodeles waltl]|uniref:Uncharacterized protein n=1 Tax=Pleurodeles waltl TaxID=8319 RepID=A0AAV7MA67_PLEWA|nr:hypothetical protein NDU88_005508 [Pleurodeles waltl]